MKLDRRSVAECGVTATPILEDLDVLKYVRLRALMPQVLVLNGWSILVEKLPRDAAFMQDCLVDMSGQYPCEAPEVIYV